MSTTSLHTSSSDTDSQLLRRARRRVGMRVGFFIHAFVFTLVNLGLFAINTATGGPLWSRFPLMGWGLGLAIHGIVTFLALSGDGMRERMVASEVEKLRRQW